MSKRFVETGMWAKPWFRKLTAVEKVIWFYLLTNCDNVGVWDADKSLGDFCIGEKVDWDGFVSKCNGNIEILENGKWFIIDYCYFQHGDLFSQKSSRALDSYIKLLMDHGLLERVRQQFGKCMGKGLESVQGKGIGKGNGKGMEQEEDDSGFGTVNKRFRFKG
jgi:hypothetical protein